MDELTLKTFIIGDLENNCYLVFDKRTKKGFLVDAPEPIREVIKFITKENLEISFVALTHAHFDHIAGLDDLALQFYVHSEDSSFLKDPKLNGSLFFSSSVKTERKPNFYPPEGFLKFEEHSLKIIHTPGHTPGSVSLKLNNWLFSGDALFFDSIGRTDIPLASHKVLIQAIKEKLLTLPENTLVYPGHGPFTDIGREKKLNSFLQ
jgi:glyoxylase-like metal-dependent hydrolase (beta-lactamase superfamily II)